MEKNIPPIVNQALNELTKKYSESTATTNAGRILRFIARVVPLDVLLKIIVHKAK